MPLDLEAEYNNRARVKNSAEIIARWTEASAAARADLAPERDIVYGPRARNVYDLYRPAVEAARAPVVAYIHGGYWQRGSKDDYAFVARELVARGVTVALPSYSLCPEASIADIVDEMEQFLASLWQRTKRRPALVGHSAGGHLAAVLMASGAKRGDAPSDLVKAAYGISGVYDLPPLIPTSLNIALRLDEPTARRLSPMFGARPAHAGTFVAGVGGNESPEFIRQARDFAAAWSSGSLETRCHIVPGADHFTMVDELTRPGSEMLECVIAMAEAVAR